MDQKNDNTPPSNLELDPTETGVCPHCSRQGRLVDFIVDDEHLRRHADPESSGVYCVCDDCEVYWFVSTQFSYHIENRSAVQDATRLLKGNYTQVEPHYPAAVTPVPAADALRGRTTPSLCRGRSCRTLDPEVLDALHQLAYQCDGEPDLDFFYKVLTELNQYSETDLWVLAVILTCRGYIELGEIVARYYALVGQLALQGRSAPDPVTWWRNAAEVADQGPF